MSTCLRCNQHHKIHARGLCQNCHKAACHTGTLNRYPLTSTRREARQRAETIATHLRAGVTRAEVVTLMGVSWDTVNGVARRQGIPTSPQPDIGPPPGEPACAGSNHPGFILDVDRKHRIRATHRDLIGEALPYCDRCPVQDWCRDLINPTRTRWTGIAGGDVYVDGEPRPELALEAVS